jgi:hypothetical protein
MGIFMSFMLTPWFQQVEAVHTGKFILQVLGGSLGLVGVPATLIIIFGMAFFCVRKDVVSVGKKIAWFVFFFATAPFGSAVYFFIVYRKRLGQVEHERI